MFSTKQLFIILIIILLALGVSVWFFPMHTSSTVKIYSQPGVAQTLLPQSLTPTTSVVLPLNPPAPEISSQISPDGTKTVMMKKQIIGQKTTYSFTVTADGKDTMIYVTSVDPSQTFSLPFDAWSPDDKYLFIKQQQTNAKYSYLVFTASGEAFGNGNQSLDLTDDFIQKEQNYVLTDVTGWAAPTLLIVNTNNADGTQGPSLWYEVTDQAFIPLATRFN